MLLQCGLAARSHPQSNDKNAVASRNSTATNSVNNLDPITGLQALFAMARSRQDVAVQLYRHPFAGQLFLAQQIGNGQIGIKLTGLAIQDDLHGRLGQLGWYGG